MNSYFLPRKQRGKKYEIILFATLKFIARKQRCKKYDFILFAMLKFIEPKQHGKKYEIILCLGAINFGKLEI